MLKRILFSFIYLSFSSLALALDIKPVVLENLDWDQGAITRETVKKSLGPAKFQEKNKDHFEIQGLRYPVTIEYKENKVVRIYARYINQKIKVEAIEGFELKNNIEDKFYYELQSKDKKIKIKVRRSNDELYSVEKFL